MQGPAMKVCSQEGVVEGLVHSVLNVKRIGCSHKG
jgi:hypothetical protein